jgi:tRNA nucleotidyltransferase/poly(A) polymerase
MRFGEDHLRMLRAIRFAAFFGFALEDETRQAVEQMTHLVTSVSPERIAAELRAMAARTGRQRAFELLDETGLAREVLVEVAPGPGQPHVRRDQWRQAAHVIGALDEPDLPLALAILAEGCAVDVVPRMAARLRLANHEAKKAAWLYGAVAELGGDSVAAIAGRAWSTLQPFVSHAEAAALADCLRARAACGRGDAEAAAWFTAQASRPRGEIDPPPLVTGSDLLAAGVAEGKAIGAALTRVRALQLDGVITTRADAIAEALR